MESNPIGSNLLLVVLGWLCFMLHGRWSDKRAAACPTPPTPTRPRRKRSPDPQPFAGLIHKPVCEACERARKARPHPPSSPPPALTFTRGRSATSIRRLNAVPRRTAPLMAGAVVAPSGPPDILAAHPGDSWRVWPAAAMSKRASASCCMARACHPRCWCGPWGLWPKGWVFALSPGCSRSTRTRCCRGWWKPPTTPPHFCPTSGTT
jgi:hypothetical protein